MENSFFKVWGSSCHAREKLRGERFEIFLAWRRGVSIIDLISQASAICSFTLCHLKDSHHGNLDLLSDFFFDSASQNCALAWTYSNKPTQSFPLISGVHVMLSLLCVPDSFLQTDSKVNFRGKKKKSDQGVGRAQLSLCRRAEGMAGRGSVLSPHSQSGTRQVHTSSGLQEQVRSF